MIFSLLRFSIATILAASLLPLRICGASDFERQPVVNGFDVNPRSISTALLIGRDSSGGGLCSGAVISRYLILTAAHCVKSFARLNAPTGRKVLAVVRGKKRWAKSGYVLRGVDVGLIQFSERLPGPAIPITNKLEPGFGEVVLALGYGDPKSGVLAAGFLTMVGYRRVHELVFESSEQTSLCHGDSGGPALRYVNGRPFIVGVNAAGTNLQCTTEGGYSIIESLAYRPTFRAIKSAIRAERLN